ncbi:PREDICTED: glycosyltransferase family 92 protein Os08g0121900 [Tarenaya hassleriana]|uniref:glycosyltransferase family 92 protein Os08g0121900 n=1 Tax=Tarenaya hassleriana TaxID=28532 RepID=UPI00053C2705|nr:PREDICTED: glycosyltransferase family 92 protein Os08g0121900 [Tarenaya hassleriana]
MAPSFKLASLSSNNRSLPKSVSPTTGDDKSTSNPLDFPASFIESARCRAPKTLFLILVSLSAFGFFSLYCSPNAISHVAFIANRPAEFGLVNYATRDTGTDPDDSIPPSHHHNQHHSIVSLATSGRRIRSDAVLWPGWEILVIVSPEEKVMPPIPAENYTCVYPNGENPPARFTAVLPFMNRTVFRCSLPGIYRHHHPIPTPILASSPSFNLPSETQWLDLPLWNFVVFEAISTETDVVVLVKGPNRGLGSNKPPETYRCVFGKDSKTLAAARTAVTSSVQEVFRCSHPNRTFEMPVKISLESATATVKNVPSVAYYTPPRRTIAETRGKSLLCATTMVYNVAKFLREWVMYHARIGIQRFIIYDNESDDDINDVVQGLNHDGYDVVKVLWIWPKTQEAGFSHSAVYGNQSCTWMMYLDVDEFLFSPMWRNQSRPSDRLIRSLLPGRGIGQVSFKSYEFGPSNQTVNPPHGVTQGYTCRRVEEQRHKSIVRLDAVDHSLYTAIHHFGLNNGSRWRVMETTVAAVNHYKYQAWEEFKSKFRRRVSAYVVDWTRVSNPKSRDRTPGLGFRPIEPKGWANKFCEVKDDRLRKLTRKWFGYPEGNGYRMAWQI